MAADRSSLTPRSDATRRTASEHAAAYAASARLEGEGRRMPIADVRRFQEVFSVAEDESAALDGLLVLLGTHFSARHQVRDTNIITTMLEHAIRHRLTFNTADFRRFAEIIELEPTQ